MCFRVDLSKPLGPDTLVVGEDVVLSAIHKKGNFKFKFVFWQGILMVTILELGIQRTRVGGHTKEFKPTQNIDISITFPNQVSGTQSKPSIETKVALQN